MIRISWVSLLHGVAGGLLLMAGACGILGVPSRIRAGQLYTTGSVRYDAYFGEIHTQQVAAAAWADERKNARKPLLDSLHLVPDADDATIEQATKDRLSSGTLRLDVQGSDVRVVEAAVVRRESPRDVLAAVEVTARAEIERAKKLADLPNRLATLAQTGRELETHIGAEFSGEGQKPFEVREELHASYDVLFDLREGTLRERHATDQFIAELGRAVAMGSEAPPASSPPPVVKSKPVKAPASPKSEPTPKPTPPPKPAPAARVETPPPPPKPAPPPPPKPAAKSAEPEVFNP